MSGIATKSKQESWENLFRLYDELFSVLTKKQDSKVNQLSDSSIDFLGFKTPRSNLYKKKDETGNMLYELKVEVPGFKKDEIKIKVLEDSVILIEGIHKSDSEANIKQCVEEFATKSFKRKYLISNLDKDSIKAKLEDGILTVNVSSKKREKIDEIVIE